MGSFYVANPGYLEVPIMSRTKRFIPYDRRYTQPYQLTWIGIGNNTYPICGEDPRNRYERGYDKHHNTSHLRIGSFWWDCIPQVGAGRKRHKKITARLHRRQSKKLTLYELNQKDECYDTEQ